MNPDPILTSWLNAQEHEVAALAAESDILEVEPWGPSPHLAWILRLSCRGLARGDDGDVVEWSDWGVGVRFPENYLRTAGMAPPVAVLWPPHGFHPNLLGPLVCLGAVTPGTSLVELTYRVFELLSYFTVTMDERNALNPAACAWARAHQHLFPLDRRPLRRPRSAVTPMDPTVQPPRPFPCLPSDRNEP